MNDQTFYELQILKLKNLLQGAEDDPIMAPQLRARIQSAEMKLEEARRQPSSLLPKESFELARAAIFLRGGGVHDSEGIRPSLAAETLIRYEQMFVAQALHDEREAARKAGRQRRPRRAPSPVLLFTGTPRGSFGLEFVPLVPVDKSLLDIHAQALHHVADALVLVAESDSKSRDEAIRTIPPRVLHPLKQFLRALAQEGVELRLAFPNGPPRSLDSARIKNAAERLEREVIQDNVAIEGVFRGVTRESGVFDLKTASGEVITGVVADELTEEDLDRIDALTNRPCVANLQKTTVVNIGGTSTPSYVLLDATLSPLRKSILT